MMLSSGLRKVVNALKTSFWAGSILALLSGCAYFNTFYNAERYYKEGLKDEESKKGSGKAQFKKSLENAVIVARDYPESRWIDDAFFLIAMNYYWMENYEKARSQFEGFLDYFSSSPFTEEARYHYALTLIGLKQYSEGRLALQQMFDSKRFGRGARFRWALAFKEEEDWDGASSAFKGFLDRYPQGDLASDARLHLAEIELAGGDTLSAIKTYERYLKRAATSKENFERFLTLAELHYLEEDHVAARRTLRKVKGRYRDIDERSDLLTAKIELAEGDSSQAEKLLVQIPFGNSRAEAFFILANLYEIQQRYDLALAYYDTITTRERRSDYASLAEFKKSLLEARLLEPDSTDTTNVDPAEEQFKLAETYFLSFGDPGRAVEEYAKVVEGYPDSEFAPKALYGIVWLKRYRLSDTPWQADLERLLELYPESKAAKDARELLGYEEASGDST
jgi:TolA-binding protein